MKINKPQKKRHVVHGFSLIEVMISAFLMGIGLTGVVSAIGSTTAQMAHQKHITQAINVAESMMEDLLTRRRNDPQLDDGPQTGPTFNEVGERRVGGIYSTSWVVNSESGALEQLKRIRLTVTWDENGTNKTISFTTLRR